MEHEVLQLLEMLYTMISEAWGVPLGNDKCIIERDKVLNILDEVKAQLPAELAEAKRLVTARDDFIGSAKREAASIRKAAEDKARELVDEQEVVRTAKLRSNELVSTAEAQAKELYRVANAYVDDALRRTEDALGAALDEVRQSRTRFRAASSAVAQKQSKVNIDKISPDELEE